MSAGPATRKANRFRQFRRDSYRQTWREGALIWLAGVILLTCSPPGVSAAPPATAAQLYQTNCARCHGADGHNPRLLGVFPDLPDFTSPKWQVTHPASELKKVILYGGKDGMPGYHDELGVVKVGDVIRYVRTLAPKEQAGSAKAPVSLDGKVSVAKTAFAPSPAPPAVRAVLSEQLARCHGTAGRNPQMAEVFPDLPDFTSAKWQATHPASELKRVILHGKGAMPGYQGDLDGINVKELVQHLRHLSPQEPRR